MSKPAECDRAAVVRQAALRSALRPQPDTVAEGNVGNSRGKDTSACHSDVVVLHSSPLSAPAINTFKRVAQGA